MAGSAWTNQLVSQVIIAGPSGQLMVYDVSPPATNHLIASITGQAITDPYGNVTLTTITGYQHTLTPSSHYNATNLLGNGITIQTAGTEAGPWTVLAEVTYHEPASESSGNTGLFVGIPSGAELICSPTADANGNNQVVMGVSTFLRAHDPGAANAAETWHSLGTATGYTVNTARYRMCPENGSVEVDIDVIGTGSNATSVTFSNTLPAAYRPTATKVYPLTTGATLASLTVLPRVGITTGGAVNLAGTANIPNTTEYLGGFFIPTD